VLSGSPFDPAAEAGQRPGGAAVPPAVPHLPTPPEQS